MPLQANIKLSNTHQIYKRHYIQQSLTDSDQFARDRWTDRSHVRKREVNCQTLGKLP